MTSFVEKARNRQTVKFKSKRLNTILLVFAATVLNLVVMALLYFGLVLLYGRFGAPHIPPEYGAVILVGLFLVVAAFTYFGYYHLMRVLALRYDMERYFEPVFPKDTSKDRTQ